MAKSMKVGKQYKLKPNCVNLVWFIGTKSIAKQAFENAVYTVTSIDPLTNGASCKADNDEIPTQYISTDEMIYFKKVKKSIDSKR